jgi:murein DD-endopeptidase MepM/ murein hydrolase activator NlpD
MSLSFRTIMLVMGLLPGIVAAADLDAVKADGRELSDAFHAGDTDAVWERMTPQMQSALKSAQAFATFREQAGAQLGSEKEVIDEKTLEQDGYAVYLRRSRFENFDGVIVTQWAFDAEGRVAGFFIRPDQSGAATPAPSPHSDRRTVTPLRLPFDDEYYVFWGGRNAEQNYHVIDPNQRFAYDFVIMRDGATHAGDGRRNEDYYCYDRPILAPAAGAVAEVVDGVADNLPGQMDASVVTGNRIVIDHGHGEYSLLAHLKPGSLRVAVGERVDAGQPIARCGNSGNSSEPHLHYQLQDGPAFGTSAGLPAQFVDYLADGKPVRSGEPVRGQQVRPAS